MKYLQQLIKKPNRFVILSIITRAGVLLLLICIALWTEYTNLKLGFNSARLVDLSSGMAMGIFYRISDFFFSIFGDSLKVAQSFGGMTWSIRILGVPFTDPVAFLSILIRYHKFETGFFLGLVIPLSIAYLSGRVFCAYICPASLIFQVVNRVRRMLSRFFYFPELSASPHTAWMVLAAGLIAAYFFGHSIWIFVLPYFSIGQSIFNGLAFGVLSSAIAGIIVFASIDLSMGTLFTCRFLCPTGKILGTVGRKSVFSLKRERDTCIESCHACEEICPMKISPKKDETQDCTLCGQCVSLCPADCLSVGRRNTAGERQK